MIYPGLASFKYAFEVSPILLTGGIAGNIAGGGIPIIALTQPTVFSGAGLLGAGADLDLDDFLCRYYPLSGSTLGDNEVGLYPFANQQVAANAIILQPLRVSLVMLCPATPASFGYQGKSSVLSALQATLQQHDISGGTYTIATPGFFYTNCLRTRWEDMTPPPEGDMKQVQVIWRFDFIQPLVTLQQAQQAQNNLMGKISSQTQFTGAPTWSGTVATQGNPYSGVTPSVIPTTSGQPGAAVVGSLGAPANATGGVGG